MMNFPESDALLHCSKCEDGKIYENDDYWESEDGCTVLCHDCALGNEEFLEFLDFKKKTANAWNLEMEALGI